MAKKLKFKTRLTIYNNGKKVVNCLSGKIKRIYYKLQEAKFSKPKYFISVRYSDGKRNEGWYKAKKKAKQALKAFTERSLLI